MNPRAKPARSHRCTERDSGETIARLPDEVGAGRSQLPHKDSASGEALGSYGRCKKWI